MLNKIIAATLVFLLSCSSIAGSYRSSSSSYSSRSSYSASSSYRSSPSSYKPASSYPKATFTYKPSPVAPKATTVNPTPHSAPFRPQVTPTPRPAIKTAPVVASVASKGFSSSQPTVVNNYRNNDSGFLNFNNWMLFYAMTHMGNSQAAPVAAEKKDDCQKGFFMLPEFLGGSKKCEEVK